MHYFRKIEEKNWKGRMLYDSLAYIDLVPNEGELSVWQDDGSKGLLPKLALAFCLTMGKITDLYYANIPEQKITDAGINTRQQDSTTPFMPMQSKHTNLVVPTIQDVMKVEEIMRNVINPQKPDYVAEQEIKEAFYEAISKDQIKINFNTKRFTPFRKALMEVEKLKNSYIDFSKLKNAIDINTKTCPTCNGRGLVTIK